MMYPCMRRLKWRGVGKALGYVVLAMSSTLSGQLPDLKIPLTPPEQPLPFSHKTHTGARVGCKACHPVPEPGDFATLPKTPVCMGCHSTVKKDSPHIQKLAGVHQAGERLKWAPVYRIPDWVSFSHKLHLAVEGVICESCHGPVGSRDVLAKEKDLSMAACMDCHRKREASNDCTLCHDQR